VCPEAGQPGVVPAPHLYRSETGLEAVGPGVDGESDAVLVGQVAAVRADGRVVMFLAADQHAEVVCGGVTVRYVVTVKDHRVSCGGRTWFHGA
jgi:hypothetical protein